jgi:hypothetical protein
MMKGLLRRFAYVRELEEEIERGKRALESAARYEKVLEEIKELQTKQIAGLTDLTRTFTSIKGGIIDEQALTDRIASQIEHRIDLKKEGPST